MGLEYQSRVSPLHFLIDSPETKNLQGQFWDNVLENSDEVHHEKEEEEEEEVEEEEES